MEYDNPSPSCSSTSRANTRRAVCRCLGGASRSARNMASIAGWNGSNTRAARTGVFRGGGVAEVNACRTVRRCTRYFSANSRIDRSSTRRSRRTAANNSTLDSTPAPLDDHHKVDHHRQVVESPALTG